MQVALAPVEEIPEEGARRVEFFGREVFLTRMSGQPKAIMNVCLHLGGSMEPRGDRLVCGWHNAQWDIRTGCHLAGPGPGGRLLFLPTRVIDGVLHYVYRDA